MTEKMSMDDANKAINEALQEHAQTVGQSGHDLDAICRALDMPGHERLNVQCHAIGAVLGSLAEDLVQVNPDLGRDGAMMQVLDVLEPILHRYVADVGIVHDRLPGTEHHPGRA